jgi:Putative beta-barrel porin-2, OmpL-like. bbp2
MTPTLMILVIIVLTLTGAGLGQSSDQASNGTSEQELQNRISILEHRLAALESKNADPNHSTAPEAKAPAAQISSPSEAVTTSNELPADKSKRAKAEPFAFADWSWLNGTPRTKKVPMDTAFFTPEIRDDVDYNYDFNHPLDDTISGSSEAFRANEVQLTQLGVGGDFHFDNVRPRVMTQYGMYSQATPRNDSSPAKGQWDLADAYRYVSEAYGGYHWNALHGINVDAGIFNSYVGLFSYYNFDVTFAEGDLVYAATEKLPDGTLVTDKILLIVPAAPADAKQ